MYLNKNRLFVLLLTKYVRCRFQRRFIWNEVVNFPSLILTSQLLQNYMIRPRFDGEIRGRHEQRILLLDFPLRYFDRIPTSLNYLLPSHISHKKTCSQTTCKNYIREIHMVLSHAISTFPYKPQPLFENSARLCKIFDPIQPDPVLRNFQTESARLSGFVLQRTSTHEQSAHIT